MPEPLNHPLTNLSFYRFIPLTDLPRLKAGLRTDCERLGLKGTILLAEEGVNAMVSGERAQIDRFKEFARKLFGPLPFKEGPAPEHSFRRLLVKIKKEIISVGEHELDPAHQGGKRLSPEELHRWIEEGRDFHFLDARNAYEVEVGTFRGATHLELDCSREFAGKARERAVGWKGKPLVTFCTGGIRCEKGSAVLRKLGVEEVYQLEGGILRYLEKMGSGHFEGHCFVYDWRLAVDGQLKPVPRSPDGRDFGRHKRGPVSGVSG
jgi:UPF0176 protein